MSISVGFVGLGNMGRGMAFSLQRGGYEVTGYDALAATRTELAQRGLHCVETIAALAAAVELVVLSLPTSDIVEQVVLGEGGLLHSGKVGLVIVDTTTADPNSTRRLAAELQAAGMELVDAPVIIPARSHHDAVELRPTDIGCRPHRGNGFDAADGECRYQRLIIGGEQRRPLVRRERYPSRASCYCRQGTCGFVGRGASSRGA